MAEDNELNREIAVTLLEEQGAAITTAENGREAVELFQNAPQGTFAARCGATPLCWRAQTLQN